jgi:hypothetical protein
MRRLLIMTLLLVAGCAATEPQLPVAAVPDPPSDPAALVGWWRVEGTQQVVLIDPVGLEIRDAELTTGGGLTVNGSWRADPDGRLLAFADLVFGPAILFAPDAMPEAAAEYAPDWLAKAAGYRVDGDHRIVLDGHGVEVARLVPEPPVEGSGVVDPGRAITEAEQHRFGPAAPVPPGLRPAERADVVGGWVPEGVPTSSAGIAQDSSWSGGTPQGSPTSPFVAFAEDGSWTGSDGCNGTGGRWLADTGGAFLATGAAVSTLMACDTMVDVGAWVGATRRVALDGQVLVLLDVDGTTIGRLVRGAQP